MGSGFTQNSKQKNLIKRLFSETDDLVYAAIVFTFKDVFLLFS